MHFDEFNAKGGGARAGVGYETRLHKRINLSLMINHGFGRFKNVENVAASIRNQHYSVTEFLVGIGYH